jgi:hypothetical protein
MRLISCVATALVIILIPLRVEAQTSDQETGVAAGAATGAVTGAVLGGPIGAVVGGVFGALIGGAAAPLAGQAHLHGGASGPLSLASLTRIGGTPDAPVPLNDSDTQPHYRVVSDKVVLVDRATGRIVRVVQSSGRKYRRAARTGRPPRLQRLSLVR